MTIEEMIRTAGDAGASDIHLVKGLPPRFRRDGRLEDMDGEMPVSYTHLVTFTMDYFQNGPAISEAFASGDLDFAEFGEQAAIAGISACLLYTSISAR